jgi:hypothetical protein
MCNECLGKFAFTTERRPLMERLRGIAFRIKIAYRVVRYTMSEKYATKFDAEHFKPIVTSAGDTDA